MSLERILIATSSFGEFDPTVLEPLQGPSFDLVRNSFGRMLGPKELSQLLSPCTGVIAGTERYDDSVLERAPHLKVISRCGAGLDNVDMAACHRRGIRVCITPSGPTDAVAELTLGFILGLIRNMVRADRDIRQGVWRRPMGFLLSELTVGIVGLGRIGRRVAELVGALGGKVIGFDTAVDSEWCRSRNVGVRTFSEILRESDLLSLHVPLEKELVHFIGRDQLAAMKDGSFLVNTSRGGLVDENALQDALQSEHLAGAALDVYEREPYTGPLQSNSKVILSPHVGSYARAGRISMEREAAQNLINELRRLNVLPLAPMGTPGRIP